MKDTALVTKTALSGSPARMQLVHRDNRADPRNRGRHTSRGPESLPSGWVGAQSGFGISCLVSENLRVHGSPSDGPLGVPTDMQPPTYPTPRSSPSFRPDLSRGDGGDTSPSPEASSPTAWISEDSRRE